MRKRSLVILGAAALLGAAVLWLMRRPPASPSASSAQQINHPGVVTQPKAAPATRTAVSADGDPLTLQATLLAPTPRPFMGRGLIGPAFLSEEQQGEWAAWLAEGAAGAGPPRVEALATVARWLDAPLQPNARGAVLGPISVPAAPRYRLLAWEKDGTYYFGDYYPGALPSHRHLDAGVVRGTLPTGLRLRLRNADPALGPYQLHLQRRPALDQAQAEQASAVYPAVEHMAPALALALRGDRPVSVATEAETVLVPLLPDPAIRLRLSDGTGDLSAARDVVLIAGQVQDIELDLNTLYPSERGLLELDGQVRVGSNTHGAAGATIERIFDTAVQGTGPREKQVLGDDGRFVFTRLPAAAASRFVVTLAPRPAGQRPPGPPRGEFMFMPTPEQRASGRAQTDFHMPLYRWLVLALDPVTRARLQSAAQPPYPQYLLQQGNPDGSWRSRAADHFWQQTDGLAVSLLSPGRYRIIAAASAYETYESDAAEIGDQPASAVVRLTRDVTTRECELYVHDSEDGRPLPGVRLVIIGGYGSLPARSGETDRTGRFSLGRVRAPELRIQLSPADGPPREVEVGDACREHGRAEISL